MLKIKALPPSYVTGKELERISASHTHFRGEPFWKAEDFAPYLENQNIRVWVASLYERRIAFLLTLENVDEVEIQFIATHRFFKNQGLAEALLEQLAEEAKAKEMRVIFLEVRESNQPARALYEKMSYEEIHRRKNYYTNPKEDAILMRRKLSEKEDEK